MIFNRIDTTRKVVEAIRQVRPKSLFIAADGPRLGKPGEAEKCNAVRNYVLDSIDWPCDVKTLFRDENLGCGKAVSSAISWFFSQVEEGIILEDDIVPTQSFFQFCIELLERFRNDQRIMLISGMNKQTRYSNAGNSYFFSNLGGIWGWASWRRAWKEYDFNMLKYDQKAKKKLVDLLGEKLASNRIAQFDLVKKGQVDTWDYQWGFARHINSGLSVVPVCNLIRNVGFGEDATHTDAGPDFDQKTIEMKFPLHHDTIIIADRNYDEKYFGTSLKTSCIMKIAKKLKRTFFRNIR